MSPTDGGKGTAYATWRRARVSEVEEEAAGAHPSREVSAPWRAFGREAAGGSRELGRGVGVTGGVQRPARGEGAGGSWVSAAGHGEAWRRLTPTSGRVLGQLSPLCSPPRPRVTRSGNRQVCGSGWQLQRRGTEQRHLCPEANSRVSDLAMPHLVQPGRGGGWAGGVGLRAPCQQGALARAPDAVTASLERKDVSGLNWPGCRDFGVWVWF